MFALTSKTTLLRLIAKSAVLAAAWWFLPWWLFATVWLALYFIPFFQPGQLLLTALITAWLAGLIPHGLAGIVFVGLAAFLIFGVKDLLLIDRGSAHESLVVLDFFVADLYFFRRFDSLNAQGFGWGLVWLALAYIALSLPLKNYLDDEGGGHSRQMARYGFWVGGLLVIEWALALQFLPLNYLYQAALLLLVAILFLELTLDIAKRKLNRETLFAHSAVLVLGILLAFALTNWSI